MSSEPSSVTATLNYFVPPADGSEASYIVDLASGTNTQNWGTSPHSVSIENLRGREDTVSLDTAGFQFFNHPTRHTAFSDDADIKEEYYPDCVELFKAVTGASRVFIFDHTVRRRTPGSTETPSTRQPANNVHGDQTPAAALARVHNHMPAEDVPALLQKRYQIINLWRPIHHPAHDWPLALCDFRSVDPARDLVSVAIAYPGSKRATYGVRFREGHAWKYVRGLGPEEGVLIKCFDSIQDGSVAPMTPHTAFEDPSTPSDAPKRESIEVRALVFYD
ncbi:hypothetical protein OF83DRAFT_853124 [Amylostereum chailletii]|nr:hypothetical protein OF83DRAFT_853124 [Amylostereum chailletii]